MGKKVYLEDQLERLSQDVTELLGRGATPAIEYAELNRQIAALAAEVTKIGRKLATLQSAQAAPTLPETGFLRLPQVLSLIPLSRSAWYQGIKDGLYPAPVTLGAKNYAVAWRAEDIRALIHQIGNPAPATTERKP